MTRPDLEIGKFTKTIEGETAVRTLSGGKAFKQPEDTDSITFEYPNTTTEIIRFREGGTSGTILKSLRVIYTNATKGNISSVEVI
jgi:hypothetical protein